MTEAQRLWVRESLQDHIYGQVFCDEWYEGVVSGKWDAILGFHLFLNSPSINSLALSTSASHYMRLTLLQAVRDQTRKSYPSALWSNLEEANLSCDGLVGRLLLAVFEVEISHRHNNQQH